MQSILLQSKSLEDAKKLRSILESNLHYPVYVSFDATNTKTLVGQKVLNLLIIDVDDYGVEEKELVNLLRGSGFSYPILFIVKDEESTVDFDVDKNLKVHFIRSSFEDDHFVGLTKKLLHAKGIENQEHQRYETSQSVMTDLLDLGENMAMDMYNLSMGGAYCEFDGSVQISIGDLVRLNIELGDLGRIHNMAAKVVWTTRKGNCSGKPGLGVKFIRPEDFYREMLDKI